jgi:hypothetical protein
MFSHLIHTLQSTKMGTRHSSTNALGALGANFNEHLTWMNHNELHQAQTTWVRGFIDMHQINATDLSADANIQSLFSARDAGFNTILSFKWNYQNQDFPAPGHPAHTAELDCLNNVLDLVMGQFDILVIGNEPYIEAKQTNHHLNTFYESMAETVIQSKQHSEQKADHPKQTKLYMGALNRLDQPIKRTPSIARFLSYIASQPALAGVDLHLHMPNAEAHTKMLNYALSFLRPDQTFLATEFSLIWHFKSHMGDKINPAFARKYGFPPGTKVHQFLSQGIADPFPIEMWEEFLHGESWYTCCVGFLENTMQLYRSTGRLEVATYGFCPMRFRKRAFEAGDTPWMLNGVFVGSMVQKKEGGGRYENWPWMEEFVRAQGGAGFGAGERGEL